MTSSPPFLATYGTLMRAFDACKRLEVADRLSFVSTCYLSGDLYDLGHFPGAVPGDGSIRGELFRLRDPQVWAVLDRYEGYDPNQETASLFLRRRVKLEAPTDQTAWVYWYNGDPTGHPQVTSGDWAVYVRGRDSEGY